MSDPNGKAELSNLGRPRFAVFEGLDGSGTTTQLGLLEEWLRDHHVEVDTTFEPTDGPLGSQARQAINGRQPLGPVSLALCLAADRVDHVENEVNGINRSLLAGRWVLCDRYKLSSLAYQASQGVDVSWLVLINSPARDPDLTIFIDTPADVCLERLYRRSSKRELFDDLHKLEAILDNYLRVIEERGVEGYLITVNGNQPPDDVFAELLDQLSKYLAQDSRSTGSRSFGLDRARINARKSAT